MRVLVTSYLQNRERSASHSKSSLNFLEHLKERGGEGAAGNVEGREERRGKDLNPQDVGLVASRRIVTTLKTSVVTFEAEEEAAAGEWDELLRNGICREFLHRLSIHLHCYFDACLIERFVRGFSPLRLVCILMPIHS